MPEAVCVSCGEEKDRSWERCSSCGFDPSTDEDEMAKSVYLSIGRYDNPDDQEAYSRELSKIGGDIREGRDVAFDPVDLARIRHIGQQVGTVKSLDILRALFKVFLPAILFLCATLLLLAYLKFLK